jgi:heme/copper-type cytochrome/quinol oxidase subunit 2
MSSRNEEEKSRRINWAIWFPIVVVTLGVAVWFFLFVILDFGG